MTRIDYFQHQPDLITKLRSATLEQSRFSLDAKLRALVETRVSQINHCVYCIHLHTHEARARGVSQTQLDSLPAWQESPFFDEREKAALAWAESLTHLPASHAADAEYEHLRPHFTDAEIVELSLSISLANFWNRMASGFRKQPAV